MVAATPTYTQLGMAALLPHERLALTDNITVRADGISTQGTPNRDKILKAATEGKAIAIQAENFHKEVSPLYKGRQWVAPYQVVYIYSNDR
ncbi:MAG: PglZ domain-containing protein [Lewinellaceae bacterium]|nr:PglZ domain-containing protein [Lewinellaceae bacterium]